ncbi:hypothetical protein TanjilG_00817 [Lupinus angustifolius]|uniref:BAH domain-containing protein n=1 Tax=Lupinus angustifolius TaxID=3871 RepID=A0A4P1R803_LUPAN|nr:PREDICTED: uncharacterized protein LOC109356874 isoform X1 [Lupinus angustifolius]OIW04257.1 hypothetical protein TanjilG_00817 [Lupinus angustifolius]
MSVSCRRFVEWKEQFVSQERGNRVVHYYLKDSHGESVLAVVGTERSLRHMFYVVSEEFLEIYAKDGSVSAGFKWRSRREVVDWLTSTLSKQYLPGDRNLSPGHNLAQAHEATDSINEVGALPTQITDDKGLIMSNSEVQNSDIVWSGVPWTCGKQLKHYPAFSRNGIKIAIQSFIFVMAKGENHYIAYLEDMYEDKRGQKKVRVRWFHHNQEVKGVNLVRNPHPREIFITPYSQVISAECVDGPATVLTRDHYLKCLPSFCPTSMDKIHLCFRQFRSNKVKPFDLSKLRGYYDQPILSCLHHDSIQNPEPNSIAEDEECNTGDDVKPGSKRARSGRGSPQSWIDHQGVRKLIRSQQMMVYKTFRNANYGQPDRRLLSLKKVDCQPLYNPTYKIDDKIEFLCHDSGIRGCWFRCTVLQISRKLLKVQYDDLQDEDGNGNLEEWIPTYKLAMPDKLEMRHSGRPTIRPAPAYVEQELAIEVGTAVDAWWSDGWWEGVICGVDNCGDDSVQVYFPGEGLLMKVCKKDLRISRDWLGDEWVDIKAKPDITSTMFTVNSFYTKISESLSISKDADSVGFANSCQDVLIGNKSNEPDIVEEKLVCCEGIADDVDQVHDNNPPSKKCAEGGNIEMHDCSNNGEDDGKDNKDDDNNQDFNNDDRDMEVLRTSGKDCKGAEPMEVAV